MTNESFANYKPQGMQGVRLSVKYHGPDVINAGYDKKAGLVIHREVPAHLAIESAGDALAFYPPQDIAQARLEAHLARVRTTMEAHEQARTGFGEVVDSLERILIGWNKK